MPGSPLDPRCEGTNNLIKNGAALLTSSGDVIQSLRAISGQPGDAVFGFCRRQESAPDFGARFGREYRRDARYSASPGVRD